MNSAQQVHDTYQTIDELVSALSEGERTDFADIYNSLDVPATAFEDFCSWSRDSYTRNCIVENEKFELLLLCWDKNQRTAIHDHGGEECWVKVIEGELSETIYHEDNPGKLRAVKSRTSKKGDISYMVDFMGFHRLENLTGGRTMSLHLYAKPIRNCQCFDEDSKTFNRKDLSYNTSATKAVQ